jgi:hypothetical protein
VVAASTTALPVMAGGCRGCLNTVFLCWVWPLVRKGYSTPLGAQDIPPLPQRLRVGRLRAEGVQWWSAQLAAGRRRPSIISMAWQCHRRDALFGLTISCGYGLLNVVGRPLLLKLTVESVKRQLTQAGDSSDENLRGVLLIVAIVVSMLLEGVCATASRHFLSDRIGTAVFGSCATLVQAKSTRLQGVSSLSGGTGVEPSTLIGSDLLRAFESLKLLSFFPMSVAGGIGGCVLLVMTVGRGGVIGICVMVSITLVNMRMAKRIKAVERKEMKAADRRLGIIRQVINDITPIKLSSWEESFLALIAGARKEEVSVAVFAS